jgi:hypothetical protein
MRATRSRAYRLLECAHDLPSDILHTCNRETGTHKSKTRNGYVRVSKSKLAVQVLVVLAKHGCLHHKSSLWVMTLYKIDLVGDTAPQNHFCRVVVPPQTHSCSRNGKKYEMQLKQRMREIFFSFFVGFRARTQGTRAKGDETLVLAGAIQFGEARAGVVHRLL